MEIIKKISDALYHLEKIIVGILVCVMLVSLTASVIFRYVLQSPLFWGGELAIFCLVWVTLIGGSMALKTDRSPTVTLFTDWLSPRLFKMVSTVGWAAVLAFCLYMLFYSVKWITLPNIAVQRSDALQIPMFYPYLCVPIAFFTLSVHSLCKLLETLVSGGRENR